MRYLFLTVIGLYITSCNPKESVQNAPEPIKIATIKLTDSLGTLGDIRMMLPTRYDTLFQWIRYSDCLSCFDFRYRIQSKKQKIFKENGFYWTPPSDSLEQLTILHEGYYGLHYKNNSSYTDSSTTIKSHNRFRQEILNQQKERPYLAIPIDDTVENINGKYFSIFSYKHEDSILHIVHHQLKAHTTHHGVMINFNFELRTSKKDSTADRFLDNCKYYLRTVRLNNNSTQAIE